MKEYKAKSVREMDVYKSDLKRWEERMAADGLEDVLIKLKRESKKPEKKAKPVLKKPKKPVKRAAKAGAAKRKTAKKTKAKRVTAAQKKSRKV